MIIDKTTMDKIDMSQYPGGVCEYCQKELTHDNNKLVSGYCDECAQLGADNRIKLDVTRKQWYDVVDDIKMAVINHVEYLHDGEGMEIEDIISDIRDTGFMWNINDKVIFKDE